MATPSTNRPYGKRFVGNAHTKEVHDLHNEKVNCQINKIKSAVSFTPDTAAQARGEGYDNCAY